MNYANTVIFGKRKTNGIYTKISQKPKTFYRSKISVIEKKLQSSENKAYICILGTKKSLKILKLFFYDRYLDFEKILKIGFFWPKN